MQVMMQKASTYQPICLARLPLLRNTKLRWMRKLMHSPMTIAIIEVVFDVCTLQPLCVDSLGRSRKNSP
jgi:hypothetical protein